MSVLIASLALLAQNASATQSYEGVWSSMDGNVLFVGNGRMDWQAGDRYYSALPETAPDARSLIGTYVDGKDLLTPLRARQKATDGVDWETGVDSWRDVTGAQHVYIGHLGPDFRKASNPYGEVRVTTEGSAANGEPRVVRLEASLPNGRLAFAGKFVRSMSFDSLDLTGKFADKDLTVESEGGSGRVGTVSGHLTYLGKRYSFAGKRVMGRAAIALFDDARFGLKGTGYLAWSPSSDRLSDIGQGNSKTTDQIAAFFTLVDGSVNTGIHKTLKRAA